MERPRELSRLGESDVTGEVERPREGGSRNGEPHDTPDVEPFDVVVVDVPVEVVDRAGEGA